MMAGADLAPSNGDAQQQHQAQDPFASPQTPALQSPKPCAQPPHTQRSAAYTAANALPKRDTGHERLSRQTAGYETWKSYSMDSGSSSLTTPMSSMDLEKSSIAQEPHKSRHDPEKAMYHARNDSRPTTNNQDAASANFNVDEDDDGGRQKQEENAVKILLFLSGPVVVLSALNTVWACISIVITLLTQPVRLCAKRLTFGQQLSGLLGPTLNLQLKCIYTPLPPYANEDASYHAGLLVAIHILSPFLSLGMMLVAWVLAVYWLSSVVVGDPAGMDKRDDGRETVLGLRNWWESVLMRSVKDE